MVVVVVVNVVVVVGVVVFGVVVTRRLEPAENIEDSYKEGLIIAR